MIRGPVHPSVLPRASALNASLYVVFFGESAYMLAKSRARHPGAELSQRRNSK